TAGQNGAAGATGGNCLCGNPQGADGGRGGDGGAGGRGQDGANGYGTKVAVIGAAPSFVVAGSPQALVAGTNEPNNYNFAAEPEIIVGTATCTQRNVNFSAATPAPWNLGAGATNPNQNSANPVTQYNTLGRKTIVYNGFTYNGFYPILTTPSASTPTIIASADTICRGESVTFTSSVLNGVTNFEWQTPGGTPPSFSGIQFDTITVTYNNPGTYTIRLRVNTDCCGLSPFVDYTIFVDTIPIVQVTGDTVICVGESTTLYASGGEYYIWNTGQIADSIIVSPTTTTTYTVRTFNSSGCESAPRSITVTVHPTPTVSVTPPNANLCDGDTATFVASGGATYEWSIFQSSQPPFSNNSTIVVPSTNANAFQVVAISAQGCRSLPQVVIASVLAPGVPLITTADSILCEGDTTILVGNGGNNYQWYVLGNPTPVATGPNFQVHPTVTTTYLLHCVNPITNCPSLIPDTIVVVVNPLPNPTISGPTSVCSLSTANYSTPTNATSTYLWTITGPGTLSANNVPSVTVTFGAPSPPNVVLAVRETNTITGCRRTVNRVVTVNPLPNITVTSPDPVLCLGESATLNASVSNGAS
ncbi:MAG: PKD domain-containing protein, partial [Bacteroidia bacterium]|nr:PKD domain-containing protein [Bacteroidia bacterium]